jgi:hypothetical protein
VEASSAVIQTQIHIFFAGVAMITGKQPQKYREFRLRAGFPLLLTAFYQIL